MLCLDVPCRTLINFFRSRRQLTGGQIYLFTIFLLPQLVYNSTRNSLWESQERVVFETQGTPPYSHDIGVRVSDLYPRRREQAARREQRALLRGAEDEVKGFGNRAKISRRINVRSAGSSHFYLGD